MKKITISLLIFILAFSLSACVKTTDKEHNKPNDSTNIANNPNNLVTNPFADQKEDNEQSQQTEDKKEDVDKDKKDENKKEEVKQEQPEQKPSKEEDKQEETTPEEPQHSADEILEVTYNIEALSSTLTGRETLPPVNFIVKDPYNVTGLSEERNGFSFGVATEGKPHSITVDNQNKFDGYKTNALAWDNKTSDKVLYLTFDCGYEYENLTSVMLDTLKEKDVTGAFFITMEYLEEAPEVVARMINEGHIVGNHSVNHPSNCATLSREEMAKELLGVHNFLRVNYGYNSQYFRFPTGAYSQNAIELVHSQNYRSIFWSIAHADWDPQNQPGVDLPFETITSRLHPGAVILLHTTSPDNAAILGNFIDTCFS